MTELLGLPAHPLLVHGAVVLVPLVALLSIAAMMRPVWRVRYGWYLVVAAAVGQFLLYLTNESGEAFDEAAEIGGMEKHQTLAETTAVLSFIFVVATFAAVFLARRRVRAERRNPEEAVGISPASTVAAAVSILMAVLVIVWVFRTGHAGAERVYDGVLPK